MCGKTNISVLLAKGKHGSVPGMRFLCLKETGTGVNRIVISVSKKFFKRAVKRNLLKRRIRESYRLQKRDITVEGGMDLLLIYSTKEIMSYEEIHTAVGQIIEKINKTTAKPVNDDKTEE